MMLKRRDKSGEQKGIAALEFAIVLPVVVVILFAIFEFGMAFWRKQVLTAAVREGARFGIVATATKKTEPEIIAKVKDYLAGVGYDKNIANVSVTGEGGPSGQPLVVTATYPTSFLILSRLKYGDGVDTRVDGSGSMNLSATVTMQME